MATPSAASTRACLGGGGGVLGLGDMVGDTKLAGAGVGEDTPSAAAVHFAPPPLDGDDTA